MTNKMDLLRPFREEYGKSALRRAERVLEIIVHHGVQASQAAGAAGPFHAEEIRRHCVGMMLFRSVEIDARLLHRYVPASLRR